MDNCYPGFYRLRKTWEYRLLGKMGCKQYTPHFVLLKSNNTISHPRLGVTVSRRVGNAVHRNRVKRRIREFFRTHKALLEDNMDYSVIARSGASSISSFDTNNELCGAFKISPK